YVHLGLLPDGARLPAVRELASQTRLNLKTAFRIYRGLSQEGLVEIRPQHGVFVTCSERSASRSHESDIRSFLQRVLREAKQHSLSPTRLAQLLAAEGNAKGKGMLRCAILECNPEQTRLFSEELRRKLKLDTFPVSTSAPARVRDAALQKADVLITTDFHWDEVTHWAMACHREVFRIRLNPAFHRLVVRHARRGPFPMVLTDVSFESRFRQALAPTAGSRAMKNLRFVHYRNRKLLRQVLRQVAQVYVSPLCYHEIAKHVPAAVRLVTLEDMISQESLEILHHRLFP